MAASDDDYYIYCCPADRCGLAFKNCGSKMIEHLENVHLIEGPQVYALVRDEKVRAEIFELKHRYPHMAEWTLDSYPDDDQAQAAKHKATAWHEDGGPDYTLNLYLAGDVGSGKTGLAWGILLDHISRHLPGDFVNLRQLFAAAKRSLSKGENVDPLAGLLEASNGDGHILVIDDIGAERPTPWALEQIATLVEERYLNELCTIYTSNYTPSKLIRRLGHEDIVIGKRIVSRIVESCAIVELPAADRRLRKAA